MPSFLFFKFISSICTIQSSHNCSQYAAQLVDPVVTRFATSLLTACSRVDFSTWFHGLELQEVARQKKTLAGLRAHLDFS